MSLAAQPLAELTRQASVEQAERYRRSHADADLDEIEALLESPIHEMRVAAVSIVDARARRRRTTDDERREPCELCLRRHDRIDNWDVYLDHPQVIGRSEQ